MKTFEINLKNEGASLTVYLPEPSPEMPQLENRPGVLVIPGGGYHMCSAREAEPVAFAFLAKGYAAFILRYTVGKEHDFSMPFADVQEAMEYIAANAAEWSVDALRIAAIGFSAGGHLCAALSVMGKIRPAASILVYPCILDSISPILAFPVPSLDVKVDAQTPASFIIAACEDGTVPIKNSLAYANALENAGIPFEMHIYEKGHHGFSLAEPTLFSYRDSAEYNAHIKGWFDLCITWLNKRFEFLV